MEHEGILAEIAALLGELTPTEPEKHAIGAGMAPDRPPDDDDVAVATTSHGNKHGGRRPPATVGVRHGRLVQPSDRQIRAKREGLMREPPPPPRRPAPPPPPPTRTEPEPLRAVGPLPPPPIRVEVEPGTIVEVPHFAVHTSREYKPRLGNRRWHLRFDRTGKLRSCKEKSYAQPGGPQRDTQGL
jgi:hypothetical protein